MGHEFSDAFVGFSLSGLGGRGTLRLIFVLMPAFKPPSLFHSFIHHACSCSQEVDSIGDKCCLFDFSIMALLLLSSCSTYFWSTIVRRKQTSISDCSMHINTWAGTAKNGLSISAAPSSSLHPLRPRSSPPAISSPPTSHFIPKKIIAVICLVCTPLCMLLFFFAGRVSLFPPRTGIHQTPKFGCCSQALTFPRAHIADVVEWYESKGKGEADKLLEAHADAHNEVQWALTPSLFQLVGVVSTKLKDNGERKNAKSKGN